MSVYFSFDCSPFWSCWRRLHRSRACGLSFSWWMMPRTTDELPWNDFVASSSFWLQSGLRLMLMSTALKIDYQDSLDCWNPLASYPFKQWLYSLNAVPWPSGYWQSVKVNFTNKLAHSDHSEAAGSFGAAWSILLLYLPVQAQRLLWIPACVDVQDLCLLCLLLTFTVQHDLVIHSCIWRHGKWRKMLLQHRTMKTNQMWLGRLYAAADLSVFPGRLIRVSILELF